MTNNEKHLVELYKDVVKNEEEIKEYTLKVLDDLLEEVNAGDFENQIIEYMKKKYSKDNVDFKLINILPTVYKGILAYVIEYDSDLNQGLFGGGYEFEMHNRLFKFSLYCRYDEWK